MEKVVLAAASFEKEMYYLEKEFEELPQEIKNEIKIICVTLAHKLMCTFIMGFYSNGEVYFETVKNEGFYDFDDIGAELEIKEIQRKKADIIKALSLWYVVFKTPKGEEIKNKILEN